MPRGRPQTPDLVKRIKGNRRKERLPPPDQAAPSPAAGQAEPSAAQELLTPATVDIPPFLTKPREREIFSRIMGEFVPKNIARPTDAAAYARYAAYFARWLVCKEILDTPEAGDGYYWVESKHGKRLAEHPASRMMFQLELALVRLELQLGLTPLSRQSIMRGMGALGAMAAGGLFGASEGGKAENHTGAGESASADQGPLGFLQRAAAASPAKN